MRPSLPKESYFEAALFYREKSGEMQDAARDFFLRQGIAEEELVFFDLLKRMKCGFYTRAWSRVKKTESNFIREREKRGAGLKGFRFKARLLGRKDWLDKWKLHYHIMPLGKRFTLVPLWEKKHYRPAGQRQALFLDPESAFGTGTHETTRLAAALMEGLSGKFKKVLDLGTGTGILSVAAVKLGAEKITALDCHAPSVATARLNFALNDCAASASGHFYEQALEKFRGREKVDLIAANIHSEVLIQNRERMLAWLRSGKYLIVSGILKKEFAAFAERFKAPRLRCLKKAAGRKWAAALYQKV